MLEEALSVVGLRPDEFWRMTWDEYEYVRHAHEIQQQQAMVAPRFTAWHMARMWTGETATLQQFMSLPLVDDAPAVSAAPVETNDEFFARLAKQGLI